MQTFFVETIEKAANLTSEERSKLIQLLQKQESEKQREKREKKSKTSNKKDFVLHSNTIWMKENSKNYQGKHIALKDGKLIATGRTIKEANEKAKAKGVKNPLLHYISP